MTDQDYHFPVPRHRASVDSLSSFSSSYGSMNPQSPLHPEEREEPYTHPQTPPVHFFVPHQGPPLRTRRSSNGMAPITTTGSSSESIPIPISYTPTTHRISKAKKGLKVHACEFGCGKIFTRAEHRKRHEANHRDKPLFNCSVEDCGKPFQRRDLLDRHMEKQHGAAPQPEPSRHRASSAASSTAGRAVSESPMMNSMSSFQQSPSPSLSGASQPGTPSFITPHLYSSSQVRLGTPGSFDMAPPHFTYMMPPTYVSGSSSSEVSSMGAPRFYPQEPQNFTSMQTPEMHQHQQYEQPTLLYATDDPNMPVPAPPMGYNTAAYEMYEQPNNGLGIGFEDNLAAPAPVDKTAPATAGLDPGGGSTAQFNELRPTATTMGAEDLMTSLNENTLVHYERCYWKHMGSSFTVVHRPTYHASEAGSLLRDAICALGAQASTGTLAKRHSRMLAYRARQQMSNLELRSFTTQSPLSTLQAVFLLEYLHLYRSTRPGVYSTQHFAALFRELQRAYENFGGNADFDHDRRFWVDIESRHRLLAACFVLDAHRRLLFAQPPANDASVKSTGRITRQTATVTTPPRPCTAALWTAETAEEWYSLLQDPSSHTSSSSTWTTPFEDAVEHAISLRDSETISPTIAADPTAHALQLAAFAPIEALIATASCSWLFGQKLAEPKWAEARARVRAWCSSESNGNATAAAWLAGKLLRDHFFPPTSPISGESDLAGASNQAAAPQTSRGAASSQGSLEIDWCLYLCALVLWAYTFPSVTSGGISDHQYYQSQAGHPQYRAYSTADATPPPSSTLRAGSLNPRRAETHPPLSSIPPSAPSMPPPPPHQHPQLHQPSTSPYQLHQHQFYQPQQTSSSPPPPPVPQFTSSSATMHMPSGIPPGLELADTFARPSYSSAAQASGMQASGIQASPIPPSGPVLSSIRLPPSFQPSRRSSPFPGGGGGGSGSGVLSADGNTAAPASSSPSPARETTPLKAFLDQACTEHWQDVAPLRGRGGVRPVLEAVRTALEGRLTREGKRGGVGETRAGLAGAANVQMTQQPPRATSVVEDKGALVGEAVGVLLKLGLGRGIWF